MSYFDIHVAELPELIRQKQPSILDMRDGAAFISGHLAGAVPADETHIRQLMRQRSEPVLIYCYHGHSSRELATLLCRMGLTEVYNLEGGWQAVQSATESRSEADELPSLVKMTRH